LVWRELLMLLLRQQVWELIGVCYFSDSFNAAKYERTCCICGCAIDKITWTAALFGVVVNVANA